MGWESVSEADWSSLSVCGLRASRWAVRIVQGSLVLGQLQSRVSWSSQQVEFGAWQKTKQKKNTENRKQYKDVFVEFYYHASITGLWLRLITFSGNECGLALVTGSSHVHSFNVKQVALMGLQENLLLAACDARDGPGIHQWESEWLKRSLLFAQRGPLMLSLFSDI